MIDEVEYLNIIALVPRPEDDFLELFNPLSCACIGICAKMIYTIYSAEVEPFMFFVSIIQLCVQSIPKINASAWKVEILKIRL